jgi:peptide deformylase
MGSLKIYVYGSPILRQRIKEVEEIPKDFKKYLDDMFGLLHNNNGIGLSANQVGKDMRFFITDLTSYDKNLGKEIFINPVILGSSGESTYEEGCLSVPDIRQDVTRPEKVVLQWENLDRQVFKEEFNGMMARVIQHELDHLNGIFFVDRISPLRRSFLSSKLKRIAETAEVDNK